MAAEDNRMQHHPHLREKHTRDADGNLTPRSAFHAKLAAAHAAPKPEQRYKGAKGVTAGYDGRCFLWNLAKPGNIIRNLTGHSAYRGGGVGVLAVGEHVQVEPRLTETRRVVELRDL